MEQPPRRRLPPHARHPRRLGHRVQRAGDGLRQPGRHERHRRRVHARPVDRREEALRRVAPERAGRGRRRRHPHAAADPSPTGRGPRRRRSRRRCPTPTASSSRICDEARDALPRHAGSGVHDPGRQALHAPVPHRRSAPARAAVRVAVEMAKEGLITQEEAVLRVDPAALDQLLHPTLDPKAPKKLLARGLAGEPRRGERAHRLQRRRGGAARRARASRSSSCASRRRPRTSTG